MKYLLTLVYYKDMQVSILWFPRSTSFVAVVTKIHNHWRLWNSLLKAILFCFLLFYSIQGWFSKVPSFFNKQPVIILIIQIKILCDFTQNNFYYVIMITKVATIASPILDFLIVCYNAWGNLTLTNWILK